MDFSFIESKSILIVVIACLILGYILKKWVKDVNNKYIPTILAVVGAVIACAAGGITVNNIVYGALSGLSSTGLHQAFTKCIEKGDC